MRMGVFGGGAIGLAAAIVLARAGIETHLYDSQGFETRIPTGETDARVWALGPRAIALLQRLGCVCDGERVLRYQRMRVIDATSDAAIQFGPSELGAIVEADWIRAMLIKVAKRQTLLSLHTHGVSTLSWRDQVVTGDAISDPMDGVILAEGRRAELAQSLGFQKTVTADGFQALVGTLACTLPHRGEAFHIFTAQGPLALLPLPDVNGEPRVSVVWSMRDADALELQRLDLNTVVQRLMQASEHVRGSLNWVRPAHWILLSQHHLDRDALGPCLAIGDTAHGIFPLAGLGANLGFADVCAIEEALAAHSSVDPVRLARAVERARRIEHLMTAQTMAMLQWGFASTNPWMCLMRSAIFRAADRMGPIKALVQQLAG